MKSIDDEILNAISIETTGLGDSISNATINNPNFGCDNVMMPLNLTAVGSAKFMFADAKEKLLDYALNSDLSGFERIEFKKLCDEVNNLSLTQDANGEINVCKKMRV